MLLFIIIFQMKQSKIINLYIKNLKEKWSSKKLLIEREKRLRHLFTILGKDEKTWNTITYKEIEKYIKGLKVSFNSKVTILSAIKSFVKFCNSIRQLKHIHSDAIYLPRMEIKEARYLTENQIYEILTKIDHKPLKFKTAIILLATTWARIHEICNLTKNQLNNALLVNWNYQISIIWKRKIKRPLFISPKAHDLCKILAKTHKEKTILWITKWTLSTEIRKFSKEVNIKFSAHAFRHTFITWLAKQWVSIYKIARLAWHTNINTTNRYLHSADAELSETVNMLKYR